jgi:hypothetical protein
VEVISYASKNEKSGQDSSGRHGALVGP